MLVIDPRGETLNGGTPPRVSRVGVIKASAVVAYVVVVAVAVEDVEEIVVVVIVTNTPLQESHL